MNYSIDMNEKLSSNFIETSKSILQSKYYYNVEIGGRGGGKSVCFGESLILATMADKYNSAVIMRYKEDIRPKVYGNLIDCLRYLGVQKCWKIKYKPMEMVLLDCDGNETDTSIYFFGCDDEDESKGIKATRGTGFRRAWLEEANRFSSKSVMENIINSIDRDNDNLFNCLISYNPPREEDHWINNWVVELFGGRVGKQLGYNSDEIVISQTIKKGPVSKEVKSRVHYSSYLDLIEGGKPEFISDTWFATAERSRECNPTFWRWNYLGDTTGSGANILHNIRDWEYIENINDILGCQLFYWGADCSNGGDDAFAITKVLYEPDLRDLYILDERLITGRIEKEELAINKFKQTAEAIYELNPDNESMYGDGAVPTNIAFLSKDFGVNISNAKKGRPWKKLTCAIWLSGLNNIYIDKQRTPTCYHEFKKWSYKVDKHTDKIDYSHVQDGEDHTVDSVLYSLADWITLYNDGGYEDASSIQ